MSAKLGWGQPHGTIAQFAYVVPDLRAAIDHYIADWGAGPFLVFDHFLQPGHIYRGEPGRADVAIAMGFAGQAWIELIQPLDDEPSVYRESIQARGYGLHHHGIAYADVEAALARYGARGWREAYRAPVPTGGEVVYLENPAVSPLFLELLPATEGMDALFTGLWRQSLNWDGRDPIRPFG
jgi:hypothetical protein